MFMFYNFFGLEVAHPLSTYTTGGMKYVRTYALTLSLFMFLSYGVLFDL